MLKIRWFLISMGLMMVAGPVFAAPRTASAKTRRHASYKRAVASGKSLRGAKHEGAPPMSAERATAIQSALIKRGYLTGEPTGMWDSQTMSAMGRMQADNGWQSKLTPDSRALIKLGLGGPEQAVTEPEQPR